MTPKKQGTSARANGNPLARRAREAEQKLRASIPQAAALPPEEIRESRREREARLEYQRRSAVAIGDEKAERKANELLQRARAEGREREKLRAGRRRPHKHLPSGLDEWPCVAGESGNIKLVPYGAAHTGRHVSVRRGARVVDGWEPVTEDLAEQARQLRTVCDVEARMPRRLGGEFATMDESMKRHADHARVHGGTWNHLHFDPERHTSICPEVADAIRAAAKILKDVWISVLLAKVESARVLEEQRARGPGDRVTESAVATGAFSAKAILGLTLLEMLYLRLEVPPHVNEHMVAWVHDHIAVGVKRGGGKSSKLAPAHMRALLANPSKLAAAMAGGKRRRLNS